MIDKILSAVAGEVGESLIKKVGLTPKEAEDTIELTGETAMEVVTSQMTSGNIGAVMNLFTKKKANNAAADGIQNQITSMLTQKLASQLGFSSDKITPIVSMVLPVVMNYISDKNDETDENDDSPLQEMFGGASKKMVKGALGGMLGKLF